MGMNISKGNMYPWVSHTWNPVRGICPHKCNYCYMKKFKVGELRLVEKELSTNLGTRNIIFVGSSTDMWSEDVPIEWILKVLQHSLRYNSNTYLFQSKNPARFLEIFDDYEDFIPSKVMFGTTIENNRDTSKISKAPIPIERFRAMASHPKFVSIGADSKNNNLTEPKKDKILMLIEYLKKDGIDVKIKRNLKRIIGRYHND